MQIFNMISCRMIHDEINIFARISTNLLFVVLWLFICGGQAIITMFGSRVFMVHNKGLNGPQWGLAILIGTTSMIVNFILKFVPDHWCPGIGKDSVFDRKAAARKAQKAESS